MPAIIYLFAGMARSYNFSSLRFFQHFAQHSLHTDLPRWQVQIESVLQFGGIHPRIVRAFGRRGESAGGPVCRLSKDKNQSTRGKG